MQLAVLLFAYPYFCSFSLFTSLTLVSKVLFSSDSGTLFLWNDDKIDGLNNFLCAGADGMGRNKCNA